MTNAMLAIKTIAELAVIIFFIWGLFNEKKLVRFERKLVRMFVAYRRMTALEKERAQNAGRPAARPAERPMTAARAKPAHAVSYAAPRRETGMADGRRREAAKPAGKRPAA